MCSILAIHISSPGMFDWKYNRCGTMSKLIQLEQGSEYKCDPLKTDAWLEIHTQKQLQQMSRKLLH